MKKLLLFGILIIFFIFYGCSKSCETELFTKEGECCTYVCEKDCSAGYVEGTCQCECMSPENEGNDNIEQDDMNINDIFDDDSNVEPPPIPI